MYVLQFYIWCVTIYSHIVSCYGDKVTVPLKTLVQHTCAKVPEKAEYRSKMAQVRLHEVYTYYMHLNGIYIRLLLPLSY